MKPERARCHARLLETERRSRQRHIGERRARDRERKRKLRALYRDEINARQREWRKQWTEDQRAKQRERQRKWITANPGKARECQLAASHRWRAKHGNEYRLKMREKYNAYMREWWKRNRERVNEKRRSIKQTRIRTDMAFFLRLRLIARIHQGYRKEIGRGASKLVRDCLGCSYNEAVVHIESKFLPGMSWDNRQLWDIDHIQPLNKFNLKDPSQQALAFHYTNLQPLWRADNIRKGAR